MELDSMGNVAGNTISGRVTGVAVFGPGLSDITTDQNFTEVAPGNGNSRFIGGRLRNAGNTFIVNDNLSGPNFRVLVQDLPGPIVPIGGDDVQEIPVGNGLADQTCVSAGEDGVLDTTVVVGDDAIVGGLVTTGTNGICETTAAADDQAIPVGNGLADTTCVAAGADGVLDTIVLGGDDAIAGGVVTTGANGICETMAVGDDQELPIGNGLADQTCVTAGADGLLDTTVLGGDDAIAGGVVSTGANGICETTAAADDQAIPLNNGLPNQTCVTLGADGVLDSIAGGDDVAAADINTGANGICDTRAVADVQVIPLGNGGANSPCIGPGANTVLETVPAGDDVSAGGAINSGPNGICETTAAVGGGGAVPVDFQEIPVSDGLADQPCVTPGANAVLDTATANDDIAGGEEITPGPDGVCDSTAAGGDIQEIPVGQGAQRQLCVTVGANGALDSTVLGDDLREGDYITTGPNGLCESTAGPDDVQELPVGNGLPEQACITDGGDGFQTATAGDDVIRGPQMTPGADGVCDTTGTGNDAQVIPATQGVPDRQCVTPGADGVLNTVVTIGDDVSVGGIITTGPDGICETASATIVVGAADDVQLLPVGQGTPNLICVTAGPDGFLDSTAGGDDVAGADINTGANGICETRAVLDDQIIPVAQGSPNQACVTAGADGVLDTTVLGGDDAIAGGVVNTGANGICETTAALDDQALPVGQGLPNQACVTAGADGVLDTTVLGGDDAIAGGVVNTGANGICETMAVGDDQALPLGEGLPNQDCVTAGADGTLDTTTPVGDDVLGAAIDTGANGICETTAALDDQTLPVGQGLPDQTCVSAGVNGVLDTPTPVPDDVIVGTEITTGANGICQTTAADGTFTLVDDDDFNADDGANLDGDDTENVAFPNRSLLQPNDDGACADGSCNVFSYAYVQPAYDIGGNNNVAFVLNTPDSTPAGEGAALIGTYEFANSATEASTTFWTVYMLGAYQMQTEEDCDADGCTAGQVDALNGLGASTFMESAREFRGLVPAPLGTIGAVTGHEVGHLFNGDHCDLGLMGSPGDPRNCPGATITFSSASLTKIRNLPHP